MDQEPQNQILCKKHTTTYILIFAVAFILGIGAGALILKNKIWSGQGEENTYDSGWNAAQAHFARLSATESICEVGETTLIPGKIKSISANSVVLEALHIDGLAKEYSFIVASTTKFIELEPMDQVIFQKKMAEFQKAIKESSPGSTKSGLVAPIPFIEKSIRWNDINAGSTVSVESRSSIANKGIFYAIKVTVVPVSTGGISGN